MVFDAHDRAVRLLQGRCTRGIYDKMKKAVETIPSRKERASTSASSDGRALPGDPFAEPGVGLGARVGRNPGRGDWVLASAYSSGDWG